MKKTKSIQKIIAVFLLIIFISACAGRKESVNKDDENFSSQKDNVSFETININSWLNLMPGDSPSFHISGDIKINYAEEEQIADLNLYKIIIYQDEQILYTFRPFFTYNLKKTDTASYSEPAKEITFTPDKKLPIVDELDDSKPISAELHFKTNDAEYSYTIENISIEKAY